MSTLLTASTEGGLEYPAMLGLAAASFTIGGAGLFFLDALTGHALTGHVLDRPWMRAVAVAVIPAAIGVQVYRRRKTLANDGIAPASGTAVDEGPANPDTP